MGTPHMRFSLSGCNRGVRTFFLAGGMLWVAAARAIAGGQGFPTPHMLEEHYERHGHEFGPISREKYLHLAQKLRDARPGPNILESKRPDGVIKFDVKHGYFGEYYRDGAIRTFFIPPDGVRYFQLQSRR